MDFVKYSGAGNDFIAVDNRDGSLDTLLTAEFIGRICRRGMDVGADGLLELRPDNEHKFRMKYYNSNGYPAEMCGNGGRCMAMFAFSRGIVSSDERFTFTSDAGTHIAVITGWNSSRIWMTRPEVFFQSKLLETGSGPVQVSFADTGVPHAVVFDNESDLGFPAAAPLLRNHPEFGIAGANVDFVYLAPDGSGISIRTWERGVEGETLACGTGAVACAVFLHRRDPSLLPVELRVRSGEVLTVGRDENGWWLDGEAREVFCGTLNAETEET